MARDLAGQDRRLTGQLRVTCSETLAYRLLTHHVARFRAAQPGIVVELMVDSRVLNLSRREADVALRVARPREGDLWGRKLADVAWTAYGAADYLAGVPQLASPADLGSHPLIGWEEGTAGINAAEWLAQAAPSAAVVYRTNSLVNQLVAARAGIGLAVLPCYLGDPEPGWSARCQADRCRRWHASCGSSRTRTCAGRHGCARSSMPSLRASGQTGC